MVESSRIWSGPSGLVAVYLVEGGVRVDIVGDVGSRTKTEVAVDYASNTVGIECVHREYAIHCHQVICVTSTVRLPGCSDGYVVYDSLLNAEQRFQVAFGWVYVPPDGDAVCECGVGVAVVQREQVFVVQ